MGQKLKNATQKDAQIMLKMEECASSMGLRSNENDVARKDAQIKLKEEDCASGMGQRRNNAVVKDALTLL